jgi:hypothetical protein
MRQIADAHVAEPGLAVVEVAAADDETALAIQELLTRGRRPPPVARGAVTVSAHGEIDMAGPSIHLTSDDEERGFASISADLAGRQGWLVGAERWRLIPGAQPVAFVSDDDQVLWAYADRQSFEDVLGATAVEVTAERRVRLLAPRTSAALTSARLPWLGLLALGWVLALPVLVTPSTWLLSWALCALSLGAVVVACVQLPKRLGRAADRTDGWEVMQRRDPALGP